MNHETIREKVYALYDGELPPVEQEEIRAHLQACLECRQLHGRWEKITRLFFHLAEPPASEAFVTRVMANLPARKAQGAPNGWAIFTRWAFPALGLSLAGFMLAMAAPLQELRAATDNYFFAQGQENLSTPLLELGQEDL